jgi:hypothetical protein
MKIEPLNKSAIINIDFPFDQPNDFRADGKVATSFATLKEQIDKAKSLGFDAVSFDTNVPIDVRTGKLQLFISADIPYTVNRDKSFSEEIWKGIQYAETVGLKTVIDLNVRNALNDEAVTTTSVLSTFDSREFFDSVKKFETEIAARAQTYGVDAITIGQMNFGFDTESYKAKWTEVVSSIRAVYSGTLRYASNIENIDNPIWKLVDDIQIYLDPKWPLQKNYTKENIAPLYLAKYIDGRREWSAKSTNELLEQYRNKYPAKSLSLEVIFLAGQSAGNEFADPWGYVFAADPGKENAKDQANLKIFPNELIDTKLNQEKIAGFFEYLGNYLADDVSSVQYWQYAPWTEANWIRNPQDFQSQVWQSVARAGYALNWNPEAEAALATYLNRDWGFRTLHYGTEQADQLAGSEIDDKFFGSSANDTVNGGLGIDTVKYTGNSSSYKLNRSADSVSIDKSNSSGRDLLNNVERLVFDDRAIAFDINGVAGRGYRIYKAAFDRIPDTGGLGYWIAQMDKGMDVVEVAARFIDSPEFRSLYGTNPSNAEFLTTVYRNVLDRTPDDAGLAWWVNEMKTNPAKSWQKVLADFSESTENQANVASLIVDGIAYHIWT